MADDTLPVQSGILDPLIGAGFFTPNMSLEEIKRRRAIGAALASRARPFPKTIGEGLTYFGEALAEGRAERQLIEAEKGYNERYNKATGTPGTAGDTLPPVVSPPRPVADVPSDVVPPPVATATALPPAAARPSPAPPAPAGPMPGVGNRADIARALAMRNPAMADMIAQIGGQGASPPGPMVTANASLAPPNAGAAPAGPAPDGATFASDEGPNPPTVSRDIRPMVMAQAGPAAAPVQPPATPGGTLAPVIPPDPGPMPAPPVRDERLTPNEQRWQNIMRQFPGDPRAEREFKQAHELGKAARDAEYERRKHANDIEVREWARRRAERDAATTSAPQTLQTLQKGAATVKQAQEDEATRAQWGNLPAPVQKDLFESRDAAKAAAGSISALNNAEAVLNAGTLVGPTAQARMLYHKTLALAGNEESQRILANTQTFQATLGPAVMAAVKAYGGPQVSNTDREYAAAMVGSDITLSEAAIRRIIDIGKRSAQAALSEHRSKADEHAKDAPALRKFLEVSDPLAAAPKLSEGAKPAPAAPAAAVPTGPPRAFASEAEAEAAGLPKGTPVIINGRRGRIN